MVIRIIIDPQTKVAQGVEMVQNGKMRNITVSKEVIISGGAINSPQLLMLSGIGPKHHLSSLKIPVLQNLKVGYNLMDHVSCSLLFNVEKLYTLNLDEATSVANMANYFHHGIGPFSLAGTCEALTFYDHKNPINSDGYPDFELLYCSGSILGDYPVHVGQGLREVIYERSYKDNIGKKTFTIRPILLKPKSRGRLMLASNNYKTKPMIFPNYYKVKEDIETMVAGIRLAINITRQKAFSEFSVKQYKIFLNNCKQYTDNSDEYYKCYARHLTLTTYHPSGTCKMGPASDKHAVVDPRLRVYGIKGLRVIDASIMPVIPRGHLSAPTYMIGEKGADMIKEDWRFKS